MDLTPRTKCRRLPLTTPPGTWLMLWHLTAQYVSRLHPQSSPTPSIFGRGSASLHFGKKPLRPSGREIMTSGLPSAVPRHRSCVTVSGAYVCSCGHKLSLTAALSLTPTPPATPTVSARFRSAVNPMPPLAIPSRRCRSASFLPPIARELYCQQRSSHP